MQLAVCRMSLMILLVKRPKCLIFYAYRAQWKVEKINKKSQFSVTGMKSEGLYRVSGFSEHIEDVRLAFDRGL